MVMRTDNVIFGALMFVIIFSTTILIWAALYDASDRKRLMAQCLVDGHKEYECVGMLNNGGGGMYPVIVPMPVPMRR